MLGTGDPGGAPESGVAPGEDFATASDVAAAQDATNAQDAGNSWDAANARDGATTPCALPPGDQARDSVLAIVPAHNEAPRLGAVVRSLVEQGLTVLVVDDGSTDGTSQVAEEAGARVIRLEPNRGKGAALKAGFRLALDETIDGGVHASPRGAGGEGRPIGVSAGSPGPPAGDSAAAGYRAAILTLDGDGQHDPTQVPAFLDAWRENDADLVVGSRDYRQMPPIRWFTNTVSRRLFAWALGEVIQDNQSGYRLRSRRLAEAVLVSPEEGFAFEVEEIAICVGRGYKLAWVPIPTIYGTETSDIKPWTHFVSFLRVTRRARRRMREERRRIPCD